MKYAVRAKLKENVPASGSALTFGSHAASSASWRRCRTLQRDSSNSRSLRATASSNDATNVQSSVGGAPPCWRVNSARSAASGAIGSSIAP
jgi:hypothetical protein